MDTVAPTTPQPSHETFLQRVKDGVDKVKAFFEDQPEALQKFEETAGAEALPTIAKDAEAAVAMAANKLPAWMQPYLPRLIALIDAEIEAKRDAYQRDLLNLGQVRNQLSYAVTPPPAPTVAAAPVAEAEPMILTVKAP